MGRLYTTMVVYTTFWPNWSSFGRLFNWKVVFQQKWFVFWSFFHSLHYNVDMYFSWFASVLLSFLEKSSFGRIFSHLGRLFVFDWSYFGPLLTKSWLYFGRFFIPCTIMLTCILVDLQVFCCHSWKSRLLVAFLVILVVFFVLDWSYFGRLLTKSWSYFGRLFSNIWSYFYLTTLDICTCLLAYL